jgi:hypothetical protein
MSKTSFRVAIILSLLVLSALPSLAWDETGHKLVAYIAWQRMTPDVREKVVKILLSAPEDAQLSTFYMLYGPRTVEARRREFFMFAATWSDVIKDKAFETRYGKYNHSDWHYYDTLWTEKDGKIEFLKAPDDGGKLMEKLADFDKVIRGNAPNAEKAIAIAWLEHLIGDLHQPLHTSGRVTGDDAKGDEGGNKFSIKSKDTGRAMKLHAFWDGVIGQNIPNTADVCESDYLDPIGQAILKAFPADTLKDRLAPAKYDVWEKESVDISTKEVYKGVNKGEVPSDEYRKKALNIAEERIALAGYRLGDLFNDVFGVKPIATAADIPCKIIRRVKYPVTQTSSEKQTLEIALLDQCPIEVAARPMYTFMIDGKPVMKEYDVIQIFKTEAAARKFAAANNITDIIF